MGYQLELYKDWKHKSSDTERVQMHTLIKSKDTTMTRVEGSTLYLQNINNIINKDFIITLINFNHLDSISINDINISVSTAEMIATVLQVTPITSVTLHSYKLREELSKVAKDVKFTVLNLNEHNISDYEARDLYTRSLSKDSEIFDTIKVNCGNQPKHHNDLKNSFNFTDPKVFTIADPNVDKYMWCYIDLMSINHDLEELYLFDITISNRAAELLANFIKDNNTVLLLSLIKNTIELQGLENLSKSLKYNTSIQELCIGDSDIGDEGCIALINHLKDNNTINKLSIYGNNIGTKSVDTIMDLIINNDNIQILNIHNNKIEPHDHKLLQQATDLGDTVLIDDWNIEMLGTI